MEIGHSVMHDIDFEAVRRGEKSKQKVREELRAIGSKVRSQALKDYVAWPLLSGLAGVADAA